MEVLQLVNSMKSKNRSGINGLRVHFLRQVANEISAQLSLSVNKYISSGLVLPKAAITSIFKADYQTLYLNCPAISSSILPSDIIENVIDKSLCGDMSFNVYIKASMVIEKIT